MNFNTTSLKKLFSMKNKNALVIGGSGYLGKEMTSSLLELGANVIVASRNKKLGLQNIKKLEKKYKSKVHFLEVDIAESK